MKQEELIRNGTVIGVDRSGNPVIILYNNVVHYKQGTSMTWQTVTDKRWVRNG